MARALAPGWCRGWLIALAAIQGCSEYGARIYSARPYRAARGCLDASVAIGVVQAGELPSDCPARCLLLDETLYVSSVCPPVPARARALEPAASGECAAALALFDAMAWCESPQPPSADAATQEAATQEAAALEAATQEEAPAP